MLRVAPLWLNDKHICSWVTRPVEPRLISLRGATTLAVWFQSGWRCQCSELTVGALVHASRVTSFALRVTSRDLFCECKEIHLDFRESILTSENPRTSKHPENPRESTENPRESKRIHEIRRIEEILETSGRTPP